MSVKSMYKVIFHNQDQVFEVYARAIYQSDMHGFIEVEDFLFGENSAVIVDPAEERLKSEFDNVARSYIPMHSIVRIDEVEKEGPSKIVDSAGADKVARFPGAGLVPKRD